MNHKGRFSVVMVKSSLQRGSSDCSLYAIANAFEIANNNSPANITFDQSKMRGHYNTCLQNNSLSSFPHTLNPNVTPSYRVINFNLTN